MLLVSIGLWCVVVFSLRVVVWGNPLCVLLNQTDRRVLEGADQITRRNRAPADEREVEFLRQFSRLTLLELGVFVMGVSLLVFLWVSGVLVWLSLGLLVKDLCLVILSAILARSRSEDSLFASLVNLPPWLMLTDRLSSLISAAGFLVLFLSVNNLGWW